MSRKFCSLHCLIILIGLTYSAVAQEPGLRVSPLESSVYLENAEVSDFIQDKNRFYLDCQFRWIVALWWLWLSGISETFPATAVLFQATMFYAWRKIQMEIFGLVWQEVVWVATKEKQGASETTRLRNLQPITASVSSLFLIVMENFGQVLVPMALCIWTN